MSIFLIESALRLCGIDTTNLQISFAPFIAQGDDENSKPHYVCNGVSWSVGDRSGRVTRHGRVTEFTDYIGGNQKAIPYGGTWDSRAETVYRMQRGWHLGR